MRVIVAGPRDWNYVRLLEARLDSLWLEASDEGLTIVHGDCPTGADAIADHWARRGSRQPPVGIERHPAEDHGRWPLCGPRRNEYMGSLGADLCLACCAWCRRINCDKTKPPTRHLTHGTSSMIDWALHYEIEVRRVWAS